jgi:uncharacterized protein
MNITYNNAKDKINQMRHKISLAAAQDFDFDTALVEFDDRFDYGEERFHAIGVIGSKVFFIAYTEDGDTIHPISLRQATKKEFNRYVSGTYSTY